MAIKYENECVGCPGDMGCLGSSCPYMNVPHLYCDRCGADVEELFFAEDVGLCQECFLENAQRITLYDI